MIKNKFIYIIIIPILISSIYLINIYKLYSDKDLWISKKCIDEKEEKKRMDRRSIFLSIFSVINILIYSLLVSLKVPISIILKTYTFFMDPIIGYLVSNIYLTEEALEMNKKKILNVRYFLGMISTGTFYRYLINVFIDIFISMLIMNKIQKIEIFDLEDNIIYKGIYSQLLIILVKVITYFMYVHKIQLNWVFLNTYNKYISTVLIRFVLLLSGLLFLGQTNKIIDKFIFIFAMFLFIAGSYFKLFELEAEEENKKLDKISKSKKIDKEYIISKQWKNGLINLSIILFFGICVPILYNNLENPKRTVLIISVISTLLLSLYYLYSKSSSYVKIPEKINKKCS
jgi:hypothetical protein